MSGISEDTLFRALGVDDPPPVARPDQVTLWRMSNVIHTLKTLHLDGDTLFERIRRDLDRGSKQAARAHLNFVDELLRE